MRSLKLSFTEFSIVLLALLIGACQPIQPVTQSAAPLDKQLQTTAQVLLERDVELPVSHINVKIQQVTFPVGFKTPEHTHDGPGPRYILQGDVEVIEAGETNTFHTGDIFWETGVPMTSENVGDEEAKILIVELLPIMDSVAQSAVEPLFQKEVQLPDKNVHVKIRAVTFPVGFKTPEHTHDGPGPRYILQGDVEVIEAGETNTFHTGDIFWETGVPMTSENVGSEELELLIIELLPQGATTQPNDTEKIASAMSAAPMSIAAEATIIDWPSAANPDESKELRAGINSWVCRPDNPNSPDPDPRCLDENWRKVFGMAFGPEREAHTALGIAYMLQGDSVADNDDPTLRQPPAGQEWQANSPHLMVVSPQPLDQTLYTIDRNSGGPWIMFVGTPAEHLMVPVETVESQDASDKIADAMSAAPMSIAAEAAIIDWPSDPAAGPGEELRAGTNGWVCRPDNPNSPDPDSRCLDENWRTLFGMELGPEREALNMIGFAYMLQGDSVADNDDPTLRQPPAGQEWQANAPHLMIVSSHQLDQTLYTTDRNSGGPWIMFAGTPGEHLMVPLMEPNK